MYQIIYYSTAKGISLVQEFLDDLRSQSSKDARIQLDRATHYIRYLQNYGTRIGYPIVEHLEDGIWELRPGCNRILFFQAGDAFILLHPFRKRNRKTPRSEIVKAKAERSYWLNRH